jgi:hypothetical protein
VALEFADFLRSPRPLVQKLHQPAVQFVDLFTPIGYFHGFCLSNNRLPGDKKTLIHQRHYRIT